MSGKILRMSGRAPAMAPHELEDAREAFLGACEVSEATPADWIDATIGKLQPTINSHGEKVVKLKAQPPEDWALVDHAVNASKNGGKWDDLRDRYTLQQEPNGGAA